MIEVKVNQTIGFIVEPEEAQAFFDAEDCFAYDKDGEEMMVINGIKGVDHYVYTIALYNFVFATSYEEDDYGYATRYLNVRNGYLQASLGKEKKDIIRVSPDILDEIYRAMIDQHRALLN